MPDEPIRCAVITISDRASADIRPDRSGAALVEEIKSQGWTVTGKRVIPDDLEEIKKILMAFCTSGNADLILTTGGTGFSPRDVTPEATQSVIERNAPGLVEFMRAEGFKSNPHAVLSRAVAGIRQQTLIINLPGNPDGAVENLKFILPVLPHAIALVRDSKDADKGHHLQI